MSQPIRSPAGYTPTFAIGYSGEGGELAVVDSATPLPVTLSGSPPPPAPLTGSTAQTFVAGPYAPANGLPVMLTLTGVWAGEVRVQRSSDSGVTRNGLTAAGAPWAVYNTNICEPVWIEEESGVTLFLDISVSSGTVTYRMAQ